MFLYIVALYCLLYYPGGLPHLKKRGKVVTWIGPETVFGREFDQAILSEHG